MLKKRQVDGLLRISPSHITSVNDREKGFRCALNKFGFRIPQDIAVVSFDDIPLFKLHYPPITAVNQPVEEIGRKAVEILLNQINHKVKKQGLEQIKLPTELLILSSCNNYLMMDR